MGRCKYEVEDCLEIGFGASRWGTGSRVGVAWPLHDTAQCTQTQTHTTGPSEWNSVSMHGIPVSLQVTDDDVM